MDQGTFIFLVINQFFRRNHVQELENAAFLEVGRCGACKHRHGIDAHFEARGLRDANTGSLHFEVLIAQFHPI